MIYNGNNSKKETIFHIYGGWLAKISIKDFIKKQKRIHIATIFGLLVIGLFFGQILFKDFHTGKAAGTKADPIVLSKTGFIVPVGNGYVFCPINSSNFVIYNGTTTTVSYDCNTSTSGYKVFTSDMYLSIEKESADITIITWGDINVAGVTVKNGVTLTHAPLVYNKTALGAEVHNTTLGYKQLASTMERDFSKSTGVLDNYFAQAKKVSFITSDFFRMEDGAKIDVSGRGYPGGTVLSGELHGYPDSGVDRLGGTAGATDGSTIAWSGGGSTRGKAGGSGKSVSTIYPSYTNPSLLYGGGGGTGINSSTSTYKVGGAGGGYVNINSSGKFTFFPTAQIVANGANGTFGNSDMKTSPSGGGGGGGVVVVSAGTLEFNSGSTLKPTVTAGNSYVGYPAETGTFSDIYIASTGRIEAIGGNGGESEGVATRAGGGAGGSISLLGTVSPLCEINSSSPKYPGTDKYYIPAACYADSDVVLDGMEVYADVVPVWQSATDITWNDGGIVKTTTSVSGESCYYLFTSTQLGTGQSICDTKRRFKSLTLRNGAKLTHEAVSVSDMNQDSDNDKSIADEDAGSARWKKVDIITSGDITLEDTSEIDVDGKGYSGGNNISQRGYGFGGATSNGGCYGGRGGVCSVYGDEVNPFDHGSGGAFRDYGSHPGGAGGGRIFLSTTTLTLSDTASITANGVYSTSENIFGSGSGGTISISASSGIVNGRPQARGVNNGTIFYSNYSGSLESTTVNIKADGGHLDYAGGGRILIRGFELSASVNKTLSPISRNGSDSFDPYSLQSGDQIKVSLKVNNITSNFTLTDFSPSTGSKECRIIQESIDPSNGVKSGNTKVEWLVSIADEGKKFSYNCTVQ